MAIDFPNSPTLNQTHTVGSKTWTYDGEKWVLTTSIPINDLSDVVITSPEEFQSLSYNGANWVNGHIPVVSYVRNAESTTLTTGTCVYLFGATGDHASVKRADNSSDTTSSKTIGIVGANITASNNGPVITRGYVDGIDLSTGYTEGDILWLGKNGTFTKTKTTSPDHLVFIGVVVRATNNGIIYVATQNGYELDELHNVSAGSPSSGDFLKYNGTLWVNDPINLGTDTVGNYMTDVSAGTGITISHTPGEGSTATITNAGVTSINGSTGAITGVVRTTDTGTVTSTMIADGAIVNSDINTSAAIAISKLASGTSGQVIITNGTGVPTYTTLSGDVTISPTGVVTISADSVALGTDTTGNYVSSLVAGTGIILANNSGEGSTPTISIGQAVGTTSNVTFNDLIVSGNLTVSGTTTTVNTATLNIADNLITLNSDFTAGSPTENAGIEVLRGGSATVSLRWNETNDKWELTNDGTTYGNLITASDTGTVTSAMIANGTIVDADINTSAAISLSKLASGSSAQVILGNATGVPTYTTISGDITIGNTGVTAISSGVVVDADINSSAAIAHSKLASITAGSVLLGNATNVPTATALSGDVTINSSGVTAIGTGVIVNADINASAAIDKTKISGTAITAADAGTVTSTMIADLTIVNGDISASAGIAHSKLANATAGQILLGTTTTGVITATTISGDIAITGAGVATIQPNSVALGTDTTGDYVASLVAGNGIIVTNNTGEGATPTVAVNTNVVATKQITSNLQTFMICEVGP